MPIFSSQPRISQGEQHSLQTKVKNFEKHLRIARACEDPHERLVHLKKAEKLAIKYGFPLREDVERIPLSEKQPGIVASFGK